ncbi:hypothetical protein PAMA_003641 [Pampus argenteus]
MWPQRSAASFLQIFLILLKKPAAGPGSIQHRQVRTQARPDRAGPEETRYILIGFQLEDRECVFTDPLHQQGTGSHGGPANELREVVRENSTIRCSRGSRCYGLWERRPDGEIHLLKQGCWTHTSDQQECHGDRCLVSATPSQIQNSSYRFCCCNRNLCNTNFTEDPPALRLKKTDGRDSRHTDYQSLRWKETVFIALLIGQGRYSTVFRSCLNKSCVAAKLFTSANRQTYANECSIYCLPLLQQHDNIAHFLTADERILADGQLEFLILMEYYPHGCLSRYLSLHTVDWLTCCRMIHGVTRGLAFLHTEIYRAEQYKPAVAHRDVTGRNVLIRADLSCVLTDFGLSMRLTGNQPCCPRDVDTLAISEVGTVRYMAPEVLGGALNLRDCESALKQVDVYALGLLYWESFRRCSDLFPGEAVPDYQLAFQMELGNHPSFEEMQMLVVREKYRPRFPEAWKENSLVLHSLKETMEDCWDQDAEARLTAQCAEERLSELTLLSTHTAVHNHRNLSLGRLPPQVGFASSYIKDPQVGVVKNLQGDGHLASVNRKNRDAINYNQQQAQVDNNLRETSKENLMGRSQKLFGSTGQPTTNLLFHQILQTIEVNGAVVTPHDEQDGVGGVDTSLSFIHPLPKQQNLPQRPTSLHLLPKTKETTLATSCLKLGKLKSNHRQVETGVAKMNTVTTTAAEPHLVTTLINNTNRRGNDTAGYRIHSTAVVVNGDSAGVPTLVTNGMICGGRTNPAGPQVEEEDKMEGVMSSGEDSCLNLLNFSPDEHEPLLRRVQLPVENKNLPHLHHHHHQSQAGHILSGQGSNSNNNNNRLALGSEVKIQGLEVKPEKMKSSEVSQGRGTTRSKAQLQPSSQQTSAPPVTCAVSRLENKIMLSASSAPMPSGKAPTPKTLPGLGKSHGSDTGLCVSKAPATEPVLSPGYTQSANDHLVHSVATAPDTGYEDPVCGSGPPSAEAAELSETLVSQAQDLENSTSSQGLLQPQMREVMASRRERPCSLDLSLLCASSDNNSLSTSGEKIKCRVKTPYTLKKCHPASWVVFTNTALDPDFKFSTSRSNSSQTHISSGLHRAGSIGIPRTDQSKSSMAVFLVGCGATVTTTSEPDEMTF